MSASVADWAAPNPISENRTGVIGKPVDRYEGPLKVSGTAPYAHEVETPSPPAHGVMICAAIARGRITAIDSAEAEAQPGVRLLYTHRNMPPLDTEPEPESLMAMTRTPPMLTDEVGFFGEPIGFLVADTFEQAHAAAQLVRVSYQEALPQFDLNEIMYEGQLADDDSEVRLGDFDAAFDAASVVIDDVWRTPAHNHAQMEPHATTAWWEGDNCIVHASVQLIPRTQMLIANTLGIATDKVRVLSRYIGGGFGGKGLAFYDYMLAILAARDLGQPVKTAMTRQQLFHATRHRAATRQRVRLGATPDGRLTAMSLISWTYSDRRGTFVEVASNFARRLYAAPNRLIANRFVRLDLPPPGPLRAPGEAVGMMSLESAMDELAEKLGLDPIELRLRNEPEVDPQSGRPFSIRQLSRCLREGAAAFGWDRRNPVPGQVSDGRWKVGLGVAAAIRGSPFMPAAAGMGVDLRGVVTLRQAMTDIGTGSYTILAQIAAEMMGVPMEHVRVEIGDSDLPPVMGSAGQFGASIAGGAAYAAGMKLRETLAEMAAADPASPLQGGPAGEAVFKDGRIVIGNRSDSLADLVARTGQDELYVTAISEMPSDYDAWSRQTYGAQFVEVGVDTVTGEVRLRRMLGVFAAGRILNAKLARSQLTGGMIWAAGAALTEGNSVDQRYGSFINQDLGGYLVPTQADIPDLDAIMLDEVDETANPLGIKGVGELGICGAGAAIANAVYNACGARVRDYPLTPDKVLAEIMLAEPRSWPQRVGDWLHRT